MARELAIRIVGGLVYAPISFLMFYWGGIPLLIEAAVAAIIGVSELFRMMSRAGYRPFYAVGIATGVLLVCDAHAQWHAATWVLAGSVMFALARMIATEWQAHERTGEARRQLLNDWLITLFGASYVGGLISFGILIRALPNGWALSLFAILGTAASDIFAYLIGRMWGRHKLVPAISPKKTIEGAIGGLVFSTLTGWLVGQWFALPLAPAAILGLLIGGVSIAGDLGESVLKRCAGVKDAGAWIPGQGGLLDVIDGFLFALPVVYVFGVFVF